MAQLFLVLFIVVALIVFAIITFGFYIKIFNTEEHKWFKWLAITIIAILQFIVTYIGLTILVEELTKHT